MITYIMIGVFYMFYMTSYLYIVKDETLTYGDLIQAGVLVFFWPVLLIIQMYAWSFHYNDRVFLKGKKDDDFF